MNLLLNMRCMFFIVFKFPVAVQKASDRDGIGTHVGKTYWISSPTPWPLGHPVAIFWQKPKNAVCSALLFLCVTKVVQYLRIRVCSHLSVVFRTFFELDVFWRMNCCLKWVAFISSCLWFRSLLEKIRTEMGFESTHGNRLGLAVRRLNHSANLAMFIDKSQNLLSILHLFFSLHYQSCPTSSNLSAHISLLFFRTFLNQMFSRHWICCLTWGAFQRV